MFKISYNVIFVYGLLVVDLLVNITEKLLPTITQLSDGRSSINLSGFIVVLVQIFAILCVVINLVLHFFQAADRVRQVARIQVCSNRQYDNNPNDIVQSSSLSFDKTTPMPQRCALKLVLDRYWWSLLVGLVYLVLTIILQIVRLDPDWHSAGSSIQERRLATLKEYGRRNLKVDTSEPAVVVTDFESYYEEASTNAQTRDYILTKDKPSQGSSGSELKDDHRANNVHQSTNNLLPIIVILIHKLMSTCYYVSFVVVYRATPNQIANRIFVINNNKSTCLQQ